MTCPAEMLKILHKHDNSCRNPAGPKLAGIVMFVQTFQQHQGLFLQDFVKPTGFLPDTCAIPSQKVEFIPGLFWKGMLNQDSNLEVEVIWKLIILPHRLPRRFTTAMFRWREHSYLESCRVAQHLVLHGNETLSHVWLKYMHELQQSSLSWSFSN